MGRIHCKDCGKCWETRAEFSENPGCDLVWCLNSEEAIMGRRTSGRRGNKPPHIEAPKPIEEVVEVRKRRQQVHMTTSQVLSTIDKSEDMMELIVPDVININIFVRK